jgi:hypothetical protein
VVVKMMLAISALNEIDIYWGVLSCLIFKYYQLALRVPIFVPLGLSVILFVSHVA